MIPVLKSAKQLITQLLRLMAHKVWNLEEKSRHLVVSMEGLIYRRTREIIHIILSMKH